jgi:hypothetical protein
VMFSMTNTSFMGNDNYHAVPTGDLNLIVH